MPIISGAVSWLGYQRNSFQFGNIIKYPIGLPQRLCLRSGAVSNREEIRRNPQKHPSKDTKQRPPAKTLPAWGSRRLCFLKLTPIRTLQNRTIGVNLAL